MAAVVEVPGVEVEVVEEALLRLRGAELRSLGLARLR